MSGWRRADGDLVRDLPLNRRVMPYLMPGRNESVYYFDIDLALHRTDAWLRAFNTAHPDLSADVFHLVLWGVRESMVKYPTMNRFVGGGRIYQRREISMAFAVKRRLRDGAPMAVVKRTFPADESFADLVRGVQAQSFQDRFGGPQGIDRELAWLMRLPGFGRRIAVGAVKLADRLGLLPHWFIDGDPMFASAFVAHMASFGMPAGYHHLYEYGTTGVFCVVGRPTAVPGSPTSGPDRRRVMRMTYSFDERTEDGFTAWRSIQYFKRIVEDPASAGLESDTEGSAGGGMSPGGPGGIAFGGTSVHDGEGLRPMGAE
ncbi:MAG: hypothetical protein ACKOVH_13535 [Actinomycetota bacterium]